MNDLLKNLTETISPPGHEDNIRQFISAEIENYVDRLSTDVLGNLIALKQSNKKSTKNDINNIKKIMLAAHMDEIGIMITHIDKCGFARFITLGGINIKNLIGERVQFANGVRGTINCEQLKSAQEYNNDKLYVDLGCKTYEQALELVNIGTTGGIAREYWSMGDRKVAKSMDDRVGCAVLIETIKQLHNKEINNDLYFVFTVQEEVGLRGAKTAAFGIEPDLGIAIDVTMAGDTPEPHKIDIHLGKGPAIKVKDRSLLTTPAIKELMINLAQKNNIPYQLEVLPFGGTDAGAMQLSRAGVQAGCISIPCRYVHSPSEMIDITDVENAIKLTIELINNYK